MTDEMIPNGALRPPRERTPEGLLPTRAAQASRVLAWIDQRVHASVALLVITDLVAVAVTLATAFQLPAAVLALACMLTSRVGFRLYRTRLRLAYGDDVGRALISTSIGFACATAGVIVVGEPLVREMAATVLVFLVISEIGRAIVLAATRRARRAMKRGLRTVVVSSGDVGLDLFATMLAHPEFGLHPMDVIDRTRPPRRSAASDLDASLADRSLADVIEEHCAQVVILAQDDTCSVPLVDAAIVADGLGCSVLVLPRAFEIHHDASDVERLRSYPLVRLRVDPTRRPSWWIKRLIDVVLSVVALVTLLPVLGLVALAVRSECGRVIFRQWRVGRAGQPFQLLKFTSLPAVNEVESATTWSVEGDPRIGPVGRFIRGTSLDELPQLWNVLRGDMSLVGPRPERPTFVEQFAADLGHYAARHRVPVGLTGLAQINGLRGGETSIADRARYDNYYIAVWSLWLDARILFQTVAEVVRHARRGTMN